jgi:BCD family chlorophyll transporter-like MFS transporter
MYVMLLLGMVVSAFLFGLLLREYSPLRLIQVIQGTALVTVVLNGAALWKQEARNRARGMAPRAEQRFAEAWARLTGRPGTLRLLAVIALGTAGFGMADVLLEPFGGQVLGMTVAETTRLTVVMALGGLVGFGSASHWLGRGGRPADVTVTGALVGVPAFCLVVLSAFVPSVPVLVLATLAAGLGAGLFGHGTLTATMRMAPREQVGLALGAWGAVQTTAAGIAVTVGGVIRDGLLLTGGGGYGAGAGGYLPVFALEAGLLVLAMLVALPLRAAAAAAGMRRADRVDGARLQEQTAAARVCTEAPLRAIGPQGGT